MFLGDVHGAATARQTFAEHARLTYPVIPLVFVTSDAVEQGIVVHKNVIDCDQISSGQIMLDDAYNTTLHKPYWHTNLEDAQARAKQVIAHQITLAEARLERMELRLEGEREQLRKLQALAKQIPVTGLEEDSDAKR